MEFVANIGFNVVAFIIILTIIVFIHEYGHYIVAKWSGVKIEVFSIGFGKTLWSKIDKYGTKWQCCAIPAGGYVKMFGDIDPASSPDYEKIKHMSKEEQQYAFHTKPLYKKAAVVFAGPAANIISAIILLMVMFILFGKPYTTPEISEVLPESAAEKAGLQAGDIITDIDGYTITSFADITKAIALNTGTPISITYLRNQQSYQTNAIPQLQETKTFVGETVKTPLLGIRSQAFEHKKLGVTESFGAAIDESIFIVGATLQGIGQMITGQRSAAELSGPIRIAKYSGESVRKGFATILWFMVVISINLGVINLLPVPLLDGGHLMYYIVEAITGKPVADSVEAIGAKIGLFLIISLALFATANDIFQLLIKP